MKPTQNDDEQIEIVISPIDYAVMMKEVLIRLHDLLEQKKFDKANAMNLRVRVEQQQMTKIALAVRLQWICEMKWKMRK